MDIFLPALKGHNTCKIVRNVLF